MTSADVKQHIRKRLESSSHLYAKDLEAIPEDQLLNSIGGVARTAVDFTYEVAFVNRRMAARIAGQALPDHNHDGWMKAPAEFSSKEACIAEFRGSVEALFQAWDGLAEDALEAPIATPNGETTALNMASLAATHMSYHDAQLNFIQSFHGDDSMHWD